MECLALGSQSPVVLMAGCASAPEHAWVSVVEAVPPAAPTIPTDTGAKGGQSPLRVAIAAVISPKGIVQSYWPFLSYLAERTGRPVELVQRQT